MSDTIDQMRRVFDEALRLAETKNKDYGDAWRDQGWRGNLSRIFEKAKRMRNLLWRAEAQPGAVKENARETAIDIINTMAFFVINHDSGVEWGHEEPWADTRLPVEPSWSAEEQQLPFDGQLSLSPEALQTIQEGINSVEQTDPRGLPIRVPGEELLVNGEVPPRRKRPSPQKHNIPQR